MQYTAGSVQIANGGAVFIVSAGEDWTDAKAELDASKLVYIKVLGSTLLYQVASITTPAANAGHTPASRWEANIVGVIGDATNAAASYVLHWNFTPNLGLPIPNPGDIDVAAIMGRAFAILDATWVGGGGGGGGGTDVGQGYQAQTFSAVGTMTSAQSTKSRHKMRATLNAGGAGTYTGTIVLPTTGRAAGDTCDVAMVFAASINPSVVIKNATSGGTTLWNWTGDGTATTWWASFLYNGTAWELVEDGVIA